MIDNERRACRRGRVGTSCPGGGRVRFEALGPRYERQVCSLALRMLRQEHDAEDVTRQTFLSVLEHLTELRVPGRFGGLSRLMPGLICCNFPASGGSVKGETMKCDGLLKILNEYLDGTQDPSFCVELEKHMAGCDSCQVVVDNLRQTITLHRNGEPYELSAVFREQSHTLLRHRWKTGNEGSATAS